MNYRFFDYKYNIEGFESDLFCTYHIVFIVLAYLLSIGISILLRKAKRENIRRALCILAVFAFVMEVTKISWESYYDITTGRGFNSFGILPIYSCSLFIYCLPFAAMKKDCFARRAATAYLSTVGLLFGAIGVIYCNGLNWYPFWTFGAFYSLFFHSAMFATGVYLLISGYHKPAWRDALYAFVPVLLLSIVAIPVNYKLGSDYMLIYSGGGVPLYEDLAASLAAHGLRPIYTVVMLLTHMALAALVVAIAKAISALCGKIKKNKE